MTTHVERWTRGADLHLIGCCVADQEQLEKCEGCGAVFGRALLGPDQRRHWYTPLGTRGHDVAWGDCGGDSCESWWQLHTVSRCHQAAREHAAVVTSLGL